MHISLLVHFSVRGARVGWGNFFLLLGYRAARERAARGAVRATVWQGNRLGLAAVHIHLQSRKAQTFAEAVASSTPSPREGDLGEGTCGQVSMK